MAGTTTSDPTKSASIWDSLYGTVSKAATDTLGKTVGEAGTIAQNWLNNQAKEQLLDPLERDVFRVENANRDNIQNPMTTGTSPYTNVPEAQQVLFDYKPQSSGNTAIFYIVGGVVVFFLVALMIRR